MYLNWLNYKKAEGHPDTQSFVPTLYDNLLQIRKASIGISKRVPMNFLFFRCFGKIAFRKRSGHRFTIEPPEGQTSWSGCRRLKLNMQLKFQS